MCAAEGKKPAQGECAFGPVLLQYRGKGVFCYVDE